MLLSAGLPATGAGIPWTVGSPPEPSTAIYYTSAGGGQLGVPIQTGDFNKDGFLDAVGAPFAASTMTRSNNGMVQIIFGDGTIGATINTATYAGPRLEIHGAETNSYFGVELGVADFDGDGFSDIAVGSAQGKFIGIAPRAGEVVILFGRAEWGDTVRTLDVKNLPPEQRARFIIGQRVGDRLGSWFHADDFDENNIPDLMIGMDLFDGFANNRSNTGTAVILWDVNTSHPAEPYIRVGDDLTSDVLTVISGRDASDQFGATNFAADLDDDGHLDLVIAAGVNRSGLAISSIGFSGVGGGDGPDNTRANAGECTIFWDARQLRAIRTLDLASAPPPEIATTIIYGETGADYFGEELIAGDVTGDGVADLVVGALLANAAAPAITGGAAYVIPGGTTLRGLSTLDLATPPSNLVTVFDGTEAFSISGDTIEVFDVNQDGIADILNGVPAGRRPGTSVTVGYTTVIYGGQAFPKMPARVAQGITTIPPLLSTYIVGADAGDLFAYSSGFGDFNGDGVPDYVPNAMQGDGFNNGFTNAGENYIIDGLLISKYAAAPANARLTGGKGVLPVGVWDASQPIFGPVSGYEVTFVPSGETTPMTITVPSNEILQSNLPGPGALKSVRAVMVRNNVETRSADVRFLQLSAMVTE